MDRRHKFTLESGPSYYLVVQLAVCNRTHYLVLAEIILDTKKERKKEMYDHNHTSSFQKAKIQTTEQ